MAEWAPQGTGGAPGAAPSTEAVPPAFQPYSTFPQLILSLPAGTPATAGVGLLAQPFQAPSHGTVGVFGVITGTAARFRLTVDGANYFDLNGGVNQTLGAWYGFTVQVAKGDLINVSVSVNTTVGALRVLFTEST